MASAISGNSQKKQLCCVRTLSDAQMTALKDILEAEDWALQDAPYCRFKAEREKTSVAAYTSGKLVVQGRGTEDFVEFLLEPRVLGEDAFADMQARLEQVQAPAEPFRPHAGIDESGKGDFFGPLVVACVFVETPEIAAKLAELGVRDSKQIKSDAKIAQLAKQIVPLVHGKAGLVAIGPEAYNRCYERIGSLNRLLAWGHARALENLLDKAPECTEALADKFGDERLIRNALMESGRRITLLQRTKAESDIAVAAASILARAEFVRRLGLLAEKAGLTLPKGAGPAVDEIAAQLAAKGGRTLLAGLAKMHFRTAQKALNGGFL